jgi:hypothetical protein
MSESCVNGRINPSPETKLRLFADSAGHCNRPECQRYLFSNQMVADYHIGEMAHVIASSVKGPRAEKKIEADRKADYDNLILLCPSCHTEIDKAPEVFTVEMIKDWKTNHKRRILEVVGIPKFHNRAEARRFVAACLRANKVIFDSWNPDLPYRDNPEAEEAIVWKRKMVAQIIPNNQKVLLLLEANAHLLTEDELVVSENFRQHVDDLVERHLGDNRGTSSRFPTKITDILKD